LIVQAGIYGGGVRAPCPHVVADHADPADHALDDGMTLVGEPS
jgi:hypothetical protein